MWVLNVLGSLRVGCMGRVGEEVVVGGGAKPRIDSKSNRQWMTRWKHGGGRHGDMDGCHASPRICTQLLATSDSSLITGASPQLTGDGCMYTD